MSAAPFGFVLGVGVVAGVSEFVRQLRNARRPVGVPTPPMPPPLSRAEWERVMPPSRSAWRPRWEAGYVGPGEWGDDDDWVADLVIGLTATVLAVLALATAASIVPFLIYFLLGSALTLVVLGAIAWVRRVPLPPGGRQTVVRSGAVVILAWVMLAWAEHTTYKGISRGDLRDALLAVKFSDRPSTLTETFHGSGWGLTATIILGSLVAIALVCRAIIDLGAMFSVSRLGRGSHRTFDAWMGQFYRRRPARLWVTSALAVLVGFVLAGGVALGWWDRVQRDDPTTPTSTTIPGVGSTVPARTPETGSSLASEAPPVTVDISVEVGGPPPSP